MLWNKAGKAVLAFMTGACMLLLAAPIARAASQEIQIKDHLDQTWTGEYVSYPLAFAQKACHKDSTNLILDGAPVAHQLSDVELWPDSDCVKTAVISFIVERLDPLGERKYLLSYQPNAQTSTATVADLKVEANAESCVFATSRFGIRLTLGTKTFDPAIPLADTAGPVTGFRCADRNWFGGSVMIGKSPVVSLDTTLLDRGPVFAQANSRYTFADGESMTCIFMLTAGDYAVRMHASSSADKPDDSMLLLLEKGCPLKDAVLMPGLGLYVPRGMNTVEIKKGKDADLFQLSPWQADAWFKQSPGTVRLRPTAGVTEWQLCVRDAGAWVSAQERPEWASFMTYTYEKIPEMWSFWQRKRMPFILSKDGLALQVNGAKGDRKWVMGLTKDEGLLEGRYAEKYMSVHTPLPRLNDVKDMVLSWNDSKRPRPYLMLDKRSAEASAALMHKAYEGATDLETLRSALADWTTMDLMRAPARLAFIYDMVIQSDSMDARERGILKARLAYLEYMLLDPLHWSFERGMCSGNPNMTVSRYCNIGIVACALADHPKGPEWAQYAAGWIRYWLENSVDKSGCWIESSHYARYALSCMTVASIVLRNTGVADFISHPKLKQMVLFYEKESTPPDPLRRVATNGRQLASMPVRVDPPVGRGVRGDCWPTSGLMAAATLESDPEYSKIMEWSWSQCGFVEWFSDKTGGLSSLYVNPCLPRAVPDWGSEFFPNRGYLLRSHIGTPEENYLYFISQYYRSSDGEIWPSNTGIIAKWFANGTPIGGGFVRMYSQSNQLLENRVMLACNWNPAEGKNPESGYVTQTRHDTFATLPALDYVNVLFTIPEISTCIIQIDKTAPAFPKREKEGKVPLMWRRQLMLAKPASPQDASYLVVRDTVDCDEPTQWHFWTLSDLIATPDQLGDRDALLAKKPGNAIVNCSELKGNRFTALGQFDKDCEYFVASPVNTPRYTARYGRRDSAYGVRTFNEYQDLMHLQLPGRGAYYVCLYPHRKDTAAPEFSTMGNGSIMRIVSAEGTDYCFLSESMARVEEGPGAFSGTSACAGSGDGLSAAYIKDRAEGLSISLADGGSATYGAYRLECRRAATLAVSPNWLHITLAQAGDPVTLAVDAPGRWVAANGVAGKNVEPTKNGVTVHVSAQVREVVLRREP